jgi:hypothetical protein
MSRKEKTYHFIYKTTDTRNDNFYVGMHSTDNLNDGYIGSGLRLKNLVYKHGKEIFNMEILEFHPDRCSLKKREVEIVNIDLLNEEKCLNLKEGGNGGFCNDDHKNSFINARYTTHKDFFIKHGKKCREKQVEKLHNDTDYKKRVYSKLSESLKDYYKTNNGKFKGKKHSDLTKEIIGTKSRIYQKGDKNSQFGSMWITNGVENKKIKKDNTIPDGWKLGRFIK